MNLEELAKSQSDRLRNKDVILEEIIDLCSTSGMVLDHRGIVELLSRLVEIEEKARKALLFKTE